MCIDNSCLLQLCEERPQISESQFVGMVAKAKEELREKQKQQQQQQQPTSVDGITGQQPNRQPMTDSQSGQQPQVGQPIMKFVSSVVCEV
jgi:hypothetical protein